ncbi:hypothetical protein C1752_13900 [Acaryochloris thomasi RCC1774]|uniref:Uncharacterized protein n=1 Tax=Acaryochloris thomasi RCC1774 TaxID=1764569 RepID=A0A2W1JF62_9CYAN|nr:hypothetical protein [Acaryochloris thomasi]PZD70365.1 hypothetical protein C1752_13900 [Acaryochloris thomasi RCC1774]
MPISPLPASLQKLTADLTLAQSAYIYDIRDRLLSAGDRMAEQGFSTRTIYGLRKDNKTVYKSKVCAEFVPVLRGVNVPRLRLRLPYAKQRGGGPGRTYKDEPIKGLCWVELRHEKEGNDVSDLSLLFNLSKSSRWSYAINVEEYSAFCQNLTGTDRAWTSLTDLLELALNEWKLLCYSKTTATKWCE